MAKQNGEPTSFRVPKTAELVAAHIRGRIVRGELLEDDALPSESNLMEEFSVSRPTLREAFRILESEGLITIRRGARGGARVQVPSTEVAANYAGLVLQHRGATVADVLEARAAIEPHGAGMVAARSDRKRSARALRKFQKDNSYEATDERYARTFFEFNRLLVSLTGNETLILVTAMLEMISEAATSRADAFDIAGPHLLELHRRVTRTRAKLADLIEAGDIDAAETLWRAHLVEAGKVIVRGRPGKVVDVLS
jgi:GntR family transcriptional regulator, transcriptional repressor for pyruvate dehydrogenase complex